MIAGVNDGGNTTSLGKEKIEVVGLVLLHVFWETETKPIWSTHTWRNASVQI